LKKEVKVGWKVEKVGKKVPQIYGEAAA